MWGLVRGAKLALSWLSSFPSCQNSSNHLLIQTLSHHGVSASPQPQSNRAEISQSETISQHNLFLLLNHSSDTLSRDQKAQHIIHGYHTHRSSYENTMQLLKRSKSGARETAQVKNTCFSSRGPRFSSKHPHNDSKLPIIQFQGTNFSLPLGTACTWWGTYILAGKHIHKTNLKKKKIQSIQVTILTIKVRKVQNNTYSMGLHQFSCAAITHSYKYSDLK